MRTTRIERYETYEPWQDIEPDPWERNGFAPIPAEQFDESWIVRTAPGESIIGKIFAFGHWQMALISETVRRVLATRNTRTGEVRFTTLAKAPFGADQVPIGVRLPPYHTTGLQMETTAFARVIQHPSARTPHVDIKAKWRAKHGNPDLRSEFKYPAKGYRPPR
jgi:hypothetical protein